MYNHCKDRGAVGYDTVYGYGIPDAAAAVAAAAPAPSNDSCSNATPVVPGGVYTGSLNNATFSSADGGSNCGNPANGPDVWYSVTAPTAGQLRVTTCGTSDTGGQDAGIDTILSLHDGCGGSIITCNDDWTSATTTGCSGLDAGLPRDSAVATDVVSGQVVRIRVQRYGGAASGSFTLNVFFTPANDACASAVDVSAAASAGGSGLTLTGTLSGASNDGTATCGSSGSNPDVWYTFTAPASCGNGELRVTTCGTHDLPGQDLGMDTVLSLLTGCGGSQITCNDDWTSATTPGCSGIDNGVARDSAVSAVLTPGQTVLIRVSKFGSVSTGPFLLHVFYTPANDACAAAQTVSNGTYAYCNYGATTDGPDESAACLGFGDGSIQSDIWFRYTATCSGTATVSLCGSGYDTKLGVYGGSCPTQSGTIIACNDDSCSLQSVVTWQAQSGQQYLIRLGGYGGATGSGMMSISCSSPCGSADFNCDGDLGTDADIAAFFACLAGTCPPAPCTSNADFNGDGNIGTDADIASFFSVLGGGSC